MKKQLFLLLCVLFSVSFSAPQLLSVDQIRSEYENVQAAMKNYTKIDVADNDMSTEGGEISYYYDKQKLKVIIAKYYGETGKMNEEIYLYENYPMFVYKETYNYNTPMYDKKFDDKKTKVLKERYYFDSNKNLIKYIDPKDKEITDSKIIQDKSIEIKKEVVRLLQKRNSGKK